MDIRIDGNTMNIPNGTTAIFVDTTGKILWVGNVDGETFADVMNQPIGPLDPTKEGHSELVLKVASMPVSSDKPKTVTFEELRVCRNRFGQVVKCPPR